MATEQLILVKPHLLTVQHDSIRVHTPKIEWMSNKMRRELYYPTFAAATALENAVGGLLLFNLVAHAARAGLSEQPTDTVNLYRATSLPHSPYVSLTGYDSGVVNFNLIYPQSPSGSRPFYVRTVDKQHIKRARVPSTNDQFQDALQIKEALQRYISDIDAESAVVYGPTEDEPFVTMERKDHHPLLHQITFADARRGDIIAVRFDPIANLGEEPSRDIHGSLNYVGRLIQNS